MKGTFLKFLKIFLIISAVALGILLIFGVVLSVGWPMWMGFFILVGLVGVGLGALFLRKMWLRRREERFVEEIIDQDESYLKTLEGKEKDAARDLHDRWKEAINTLRRSHLRKQGNPLYVLPWYLVIGESGSGKSTAIQSARLSSPFAEVSRVSGVSGTKNCDWWFFEQAIIIDTAGRFAIPIDEGRDKDEWQSFLTLLAKYRKKEPLNGLVVTIAADKLLEAEPEDLEHDGQSIRRRIDELMRVMGAKFPVYVLVTKCDLIQGITKFCDHLPEQSLGQAMGLINQDLSTDVSGLNDRAIHTVGERLRELRLLLLHKSESKQVDPGLLLFPEEFERLRPGLHSFIEGAFQENPFQETPLMRGLFFSSGRQEGTPYSHFLKELGLIEERDVLPGTNKGLFLHDFFARILPKDRRLFAPTQRALDWRRVTRNLALTSWLAVAIAICGLMSFSFVKNLGILRDVSREFSKPLVLQGEVLSDVITMDRFREAILRLEAQNRKWWIPRFGLNQSKEVEAQLKEKYWKRFKDGFLVSFDKDMEKRMASFSLNTSDQVIEEHVAHLMRRINLLQARLKGDGIESLQDMPQPFYRPITFKAGQGLIPEIREKLGRLYVYYLIWGPDFANLNEKRNDLQTWLKHILTLRETDLNWLVSWVNRDESLSHMTLEDFWKGSVPARDETTVAPAFTGIGKEKIDAFVREMESALPDPLIIANRKLKFEAWYHKKYIKTWENFWSTFRQGVNTLKDREEWRQVAQRMVNGQGPYFALLDRMAVELEPLAGGEDLPSWLELVYEFKETKVRAAKEDALKEKGALAKATKKGKTFIAKLEKTRGKLGKGKTLESQLMETKSFLTYQTALAEIAPVSASRMQAFKMATQVYKEEPAGSTSPFFIARGASDKLKASMTRGKSARKMFDTVATGPLNYLWTFVRRETACHLQKLWEEDVLMEVQGVSGRSRVNQLLLGQDGYATKFSKGPAEPFIGRSLRRGYYGKKAEGLGGKIPFKDFFFSFLTKGANVVRPGRDNYAVSIRALPTDTNTGAKVRPHATRLQLECSGEIQKLINLNYPVKKTFNWSPEMCGNVTLQIEVGSLILTKKYAGDRGFPKFLKIFSKGKYTFYPSAFPREKSALKRLGIRYIKVRYKFAGHRPLLKLLTVGPGRVPKSIVKCWDQ